MKVKIKEFFPPKPDLNPQIYAYTDEAYEGLLKIGYTTVDVRKRVAEQYPTKRPGNLPYKIVFEESAMRKDGTYFIDKSVHKLLIKKGIKCKGGEWFACSVEQVKAAVLALKTGIINEENRTLSFKMRPEQSEAVRRASEYFSSFKEEKRTPHFLWNCKMRFGKTFAAYQLAKTKGWKKILVLTFKPAVESAWEEDLSNHVDFEGWQFFSRHSEADYKKLKQNKPIVCFGSFQDYLGRTSIGAIKPKNEWVHKTKWDCIIFDEYHYGAWRKKAKDLFDEEEEIEQQEEELLFKENSKGLDAPEEQDKIEYLESIMPIKTSAYLYLSGTPFRAIISGEFIEEQIYHWTYSDEQRAKENWKKPNNPYEALPRIVLLTYQLPHTVINLASGGEFDTFDLNVFFSAKGERKDAKFVYEDDVQKWLDLIRGNYMATNLDNLKLGARKPPLPYSDTRLLNILSHTLWFMPNVASCNAMKNLLMQKQNKYYHDYNIVVAAGAIAGIGLDALKPVQKAMEEPLKSKSITLSCGKLTTGVTVKPWTGIFMLRNLTSPETYFQAAFRVQSPWTVKNPDGKSPNAEEIIKRECYIFDFAPNRALKQIADYSCNLNPEETDSEKKIREFIDFLPVLAYDGSTMKQIDASGIIEMAMSGTTASLLARRWESALLVNVDNNTLSKILNNPKALAALMSIEGFRSLNNDIEMIINKSEAVKKAKQKLANDENISPKEKKKLSDEEKEYMSKRKEIQNKLIKFATRIPIFMYLTDFRERTLKDVITKLEPSLFKKVTGLKVEDFELLVSLGVFNSNLMNDAVFKFKRYEEASLSYTGIYKHKIEHVGGYDIIITAEELNKKLNLTK
ncbi:restriction endonuclease [Candidatus Woesearchaeota archaeon CG10_big_fil_rev_8_21_14_0_10_33_12]|nr:MAG: restriction endonuclease [Candidatus Woesearchaeota archaeon CG10_big_fil_rev_8_21_14_0_10_33_12]